MGYAASPYGDPEENDKSQDRFSVVRGNRNTELHDRWRRARARSSGFGDPAHPFRHQGSADLNLYKLFLEAAHALLRHGGRLGFVVPSGLYSDNGTGALRRLFIERCRWEWLFGIENRDKVFPIHRSYKFNPVLVEKGGATKTIRTAFMRRKLDDWERAEDFVTAYTREQVERFSPRSRAILEIQSGRDLEILEKIYANAVLLGDDGPDGWGIRYAREFDMTNDSRLFSPRPQWEAKGYRPDEYSRWLLGDWRPIEELWAELGVDPSRPEPLDIELEEWLFDTTAGPERREAEARFVHGHLLKPGDVARTDWRTRCAQPPYDSLPIPRDRIPAGLILSREADAWIQENGIEDSAVPLYEGRMINFFDWSEKCWIRGRGRTAEWQPVPSGKKSLHPQYLMARETQLSTKSSESVKLGFLSIGSGTNSRSFYCAVVPNLPCGNSVGILTVETNTAGLLELQRQLSSFLYDFVVRTRLTGVNLNYFVIQETPLNRLVANDRIPAIASSLSLTSPLFSTESIRLRGSKRQWTGASGETWALAEQEQIRCRAILDAITLSEGGLDESDVRHLMAGCDTLDLSFGTLNPKGFWRLEKDKWPELRHTVLTLVAFHDLETKIDAAGDDLERGIESFLTQNHGEGWMLPETLRLADYGLGHDERAQHPQPVASRLGPRFYDWQLVQSTDESWRECHLHARNLLGTRGYASLLAELVGRRTKEEDGHTGLLRDGWTRELLGEEGCVTMLAEVCGQRVMQDDAYWTMVSLLRDEGDLDDRGFCQLLDRLHARGWLDDIGYRRRRGVMPSVLSAEVALRVAESPAQYQADTRSQDRQPDLFK